MLTLLAVIGNALWGGGWAFVRDQGQPEHPSPEEKARREAAGEKFPWKWLGAGIVGTPTAVLYLWRFWDIVPWAPAVALGIVVGMMGAWRMGHFDGSGLDAAPNKRGDHGFPVYLRLTASGIPLGLPLALALVYAGAWPYAIGCIVAAGLKTLCYWVAYQVRDVNAPWPHATMFGHVAHGIVAFGGFALMIMLA